MRRVTVRYHQEGDAWWAESDDLKTFSAAGASYAEVRDRARSALVGLLGSDLDFYDDVQEIGAAVGYSIDVGARSSSVLHVNSEFGTFGTSVTRGRASVAVGRPREDYAGNSENRRVEIV